LILINHDSYVAATTLQASSAIHVKDSKDPYVVDAERVMNIFSVITIPGAWVVDALPFCEFLRSSWKYVISLAFSEASPYLVSGRCFQKEGEDMSGRAR
jgi:hypothetical protein